jgi:serine/threonine protein kinase
LLFDDLADRASRRRFQREAQTASSLNHPHILTVYDAGDFEGRQYLVTEFIDGGTLKDWARAEKRTWQEIVKLLVGVADGLAAAHAGILHRDIKPDNILVGSNGYAKLSDFGLAKLEERIAPEPANRTLASMTTRPGMIQGTIAYMSPEQASGRPTDVRSDIFSFGIVLYELLAGRRPFEGATDLELLQTIIHGAASKPPAGLQCPLPCRPGRTISVPRRENPPGTPGRHCRKSRRTARGSHHSRSRSGRSETARPPTAGVERLAHQARPTKKQ